MPLRIALLLLVLIAVPAEAAEPVATLGAGGTAFWPGPFVTSSRVLDPSACGMTGQCFDYGLEVTARNAKVLRAAVSTSDDSNGWDLQLIDPNGHVAASGSTYEMGGFAEDYDEELFAHDPAPGRWTFRVIARNVEYGDFKARAAVDPPQPAAVPCTPRDRLTVTLPRGTVRSVAVYLDDELQKTVTGNRRRVGVSFLGLAPGTARVKLVVTTAKGTRTLRRNVATCPPAATTRDGAPVDMPPDLSADPPWMVTFDQPPPMVVVEGGNYTAIAGVHNPTTQVAGQPLQDCLAEESVENGAHRCLRFTSGFASLGPGHLRVFGESATFAAPQGGPLNQVVFRSDGSSYERPAGKFVFHHIHMHYHVMGIAEFRFYRVDPSTHELTEASKVLKEGFCLGNIKLYDWHSFSQVEIDPASIDNCQPQAQEDGSYRFYEGIAEGWEDSYKWQTSGQYVDFGDNPDGYYLLRVSANPDHHLLETSYANDTAYTYLEIRGDRVRTIERGHGQSPWDPNRRLEDPVITG